MGKCLGNLFGGLAMVPGKSPWAFSYGYGRERVHGDRCQSTREVAAPAQCAWRAAPHDLAYQCSPVPSGRHTSDYAGEQRDNRNPCEISRAVVRRLSRQKKGTGEGVGRCVGDGRVAGGRRSLGGGGGSGGWWWWWRRRWWWWVLRVPRVSAKN